MKPSKTKTKKSQPLNDKQKFIFEPDPFIKNTKGVKRSALISLKSILFNSILMAEGSGLDRQLIDLALTYWIGPTSAVYLPDLKKRLSLLDKVLGKERKSVK